MSKLKQCQDTHENIIYAGNECPLCRQRSYLEKLSDDKVDIDQQNIRELYKLVGKLNKRITHLEQISTDTLPYKQADIWNMQIEV